MTTIARQGYQFQLFMRTAGGDVNWRLLTGNNRESGRGVGGYADADACRTAISELQTREPELVGRVRRSEANRWTWQLLLDDRLVATAGRPADRLIRAEGGLAAFRASIAAAGIRPIVMMTEARRWRAAR